jgi:hypothetical protein
MTIPTLTPAFRTPARVTAAAALGALFLAGPFATSAQAVVEHPPLLTAENFSVLAGSEVTNTGVSTIAQDVGVSPGTSLPATTGADRLIVGGAPHSADPVADQAQVDLTAAYTNAANQIPRIAQDTELGGETKLGGIYNVDTEADMGLTGVLTLDGANNPDSIWVFQAGRALDIASAASMVLIRGANPCNVYWQVSSTATLGTSSSMVGTIMAETSVVMQTGARLQGRILAQSAEVTMDTNVITNPACEPIGLEGETDTAGPVAGGDTTPDTTGGDTTGGNGPGGNNNAAGSDNPLATDQVADVPKGSVDTGLAGSENGTTTALAPVGWMLAAGFGGLALVAWRRRRVM